MTVVAIKVSDVGRRTKGKPAPVVPVKWTRMEVILKIAERCNIDCTYCYFFNAGDDSYADHPAYIRQATVEGIADFLAKTARDSGLEELQIDFHGGEPTMLKKHRFDAMCTTFRERLSFIPRFRLAMQTNGILIDDEWIDLISKHNIGVGVSLDGPKDFNDEYRLDHRGRGTYDATVAGMRRLADAKAAGRLKHGFGVICVADYKHDGRRTLNHFVKDLGLRDLHFTFPLLTHDSTPAAELENYAKYMCDIFDAWVELNDPSVRVRFISKFLGLLLGGMEGIEQYRGGMAKNTAFTIASSGEVNAADDDRVATYAFGNGLIASGDFSVSDFYATAPMAKYFEATQVRSAECKQCCWVNVCDGGEPLAGNTQRYSSAKGFDNPSVFCAGLKAMLVRMTEFAVARGVPFEKIAQVLLDDEKAEAA